MKKTIMPKVFGWMFIGLLITFLTGYIISINENMLMNVLTPTTVIITVILELGLVIFLSARITKMKPITAKICFLLYSFITGLTFSTVFVVYEMTSIIFVFLISALVFGLFALLGATTKMDLTKLGSYLMMALIAIIICTIINMFLQNSTFDLIVSIISVIVFIGFTAYDVQKIIKLGTLDVIPEENLAIFGALDLYLDFINIFLDLLRIFGENSD